MVLSKMHQLSKSIMVGPDRTGSGQSGLTLEINSRNKNKKIYFHPKSLRSFLRIVCVVDDSHIHMQEKLLWATRGRLWRPRFASQWLLIRTWFASLTRNKYSKIWKYFYHLKNKFLCWNIFSRIRLHLICPETDMRFPACKPTKVYFYFLSKWMDYDCFFSIVN